MITPLSGQRADITYVYIYLYNITNYVKAHCVAYISVLLETLERIN